MQHKATRNISSNSPARLLGTKRKEKLQLTMLPLQLLLLKAAFKSSSHRLGIRMKLKP